MQSSSTLHRAHLPYSRYSQKTFPKVLYRSKPLLRCSVEKAFHGLLQEYLSKGLFQKNSIINVFYIRKLNSWSSIGEVLPKGLLQKKTFLEVFCGRRFSQRPSIGSFIQSSSIKEDLPKGLLSKKTFLKVWQRNNFLSVFY